MNTTSFGADPRRDRASGADMPSVETVWLVLEAANDLGDAPIVEACRRVIDADLNGVPAAPSDLQLVLDYFR
jgi:hypothetical protein